MPCVLLTPAQKDEMIADGYSIAAGPFSTEEECLDLDCDASFAFVTVVVRAYGEVTGPQITGVLDEPLNATLTLINTASTLLTMVLPTVADDGCEGCSEFDRTWVFVETSQNIWTSQTIQAECGAIESDWNWKITIDGSTTSLILYQDGVQVVRYLEFFVWDLSTDIELRLFDQTAGYCVFPEVLEINL